MPALAEAIPAPGGRGLAASIHDLKLRDGRKVRGLIGGNIVTPPRLVRTIEGATNLVIEIVDPELHWLDHALSSAKWTCTLDGLAFRYVGTSKPVGSAVMTLTFEDEIVARLREVEGPIRVYARRGTPEEVTLAEFIISVVERAPGPPIPWRCPQLEEQQPIENQKQAKKAKKEAEGKRAKGVGDTKGLTVKGQPPSAHQAELLEMAVRISNSKPCPYIAKVAVVAALIDETDAGEVDSNNVLEALEPYTKIRDAAEEISGFLFGEPTWTGVTAVDYANQHPNATPYEVAQAVQKSGAGEASNGAANYGLFVKEARDWVDAFEGDTADGVASGSKTITKPRYFYVAGEGKRQKRKPETGWDAIQRYAKEVNWRAFADLGVFYYFDEFELSRGEVRLAIVRKPGQRRPENEHIEDVGFDADEGKPVTECTVSALAAKWGVAPGAVVTVAGYGPASIGPGDPPPSRDEKGKPRLSSAVKASTHEGKGRYLNAKTEVPLIGSPAVRKATISLRKPTRPLPEKGPETETISGGKVPLTEAGGASGEMGVYAGTAEDVVNEVVFYAQKHGFPDISPQSVKEANATHGPTVDGNLSDHQGPPNVRWAADISNGYETPEEAALAAAIAGAFGIPWDGAGLVTHEAHGYRLQLIHNTMEGGNHYNHVHFGCEVM